MELNKENIDKKMDFTYIREKISILEEKFDNNTITGEETIDLIKLYKLERKNKKYKNSNSK